MENIQCDIRDSILNCTLISEDMGLPMWLSGKESACNAGDRSLIPGSGKSPGEGNGYPLHSLAWEIPWTEEPGGLQSVGVTKESNRTKRLRTHAMEGMTKDTKGDKRKKR